VAPGNEGGKVAVAESTPSCREFRELQLKFSTGVRFTELKSIAVILSMLARVKPPTREMNRNHALLMQWYCDSWAWIFPFFSVIQLRDRYDVPVDGRREIVDRRLMRLLAGQ
jgi:hypothetical protein